MFGGWDAHASINALFNVRTRGKPGESAGLILGNTDIFWHPPMPYAEFTVLCLPKEMLKAAAE